ADPRDLKSSLQNYSSADAPVVKDIKLESNNVARFDKVEITFNIDAAWENPFDPEDILVDGVFIYPSGKEVTIPAFYTTPMVPTESYKDKILMTYSPSSYDYHPDYKRKSIWCLRFSGDEVGEYSFYITVKTADGKTCKSESGTFSCYEDGLKGYAKVSESNPQYIVNSGDGSLYYGSGSNMAWVRSGEAFTDNPLHLSYNYFIGRAKQQTNITRIWICHGNWLEWTYDPNDGKTIGYLGLGYYNQIMCANFDNILEQCEDAGLRVMLCTDDNNEHEQTDTYSSWAFNPYSIENGGPAKDVADYWVNPEVREYVKKRLRYIVARWGYSSAIFSINLWNDYWKPSSEGTVEYLKDIHDYFDELIGDWRPFLFGSNFNYEANAVLDYTAQYINLTDYTKPYVTQECYYSMTDFRNVVRNTIWSELVQGAAATMVWSHDDTDEYDNGNGCWNIFDHILDFTADLPLDKAGKLTYSSIVADSATVSGSSAKNQSITSVSEYGDVFSWGEKAPADTFDIDTSLPGMNLAGFSHTLYGSSYAHIRTAPTFNFEMPFGGQFVVGVDENGWGNNTLKITLDGQVVATTAMGEGDRELISETDPRRYTYVDIPAGKHTVKIENSGPDWLSAKEIYFVSNTESTSSMLDIKSMVGDNLAVAYIQNTTYSQLATRLLGSTAADFANVKFTISGLKEDGRYAMYQFNPDTGEYGTIGEVNVAGGKAEISIEKVTRDCAVKLIKLADGEKVKAEGSRYGYLRLSSSSDIPADLPAPGSNDPAGSNLLMIIIIAVAAVIIVGGGVAAAIMLGKKKKADKPAE
ncbi:MAG: DUF5060 domain-containing protein, partial [Clostridia bacterium]|nr:DUF5060 domain-containing protein [Clostridia bacterium]